VFIGLPIYLYYRIPSLGLVITTIVLFFATGISITAGYHRLYAHRAYKANKLFQIFLLIFGTMTMQSSVVYWSHKHRLHHRFVDQEGDPHNINEGFWHAHVGWLLKKQIPIDKKIIPDLIENKLTSFQHKYYHLLTFSLNITVFLFLGFIFKDYWGAFVIGWWTRVFFLNNATWFINSLAHTWGAKTYSREQTAVNNAIVALLTFGEGYHNYHHVFASDYRNGIRWYQFDPTKWLIWFSNKLGMTKGLKKVDKYVSKNKIIMEDKYIFLKALKESTYEKKHALEKKVVDMSEQLSAKINGIKKTLQESQELRKNKAKKSTLKPLNTKIRNLQSKLKTDWKAWRRLEKEISRHAVLQHHH
jgi:stearoyl-CoA desaturase (delta-9 desaturase)